MQKKLQTTISLVTTVACLIGLGLLPTSAMQDNDPANRQDNELARLKAQIKKTRCRENVVSAKGPSDIHHLWMVHTYAAEKGYVGVWQVRIGESVNIYKSYKTFPIKMDCPNCAQVATLYEKLLGSCSK